MSDARAKAEGLVEDGLQLYSCGQLDQALAKWHAALQLEAGVPRAREYIQYVTENRSALEAGFGAESQAGGASSPVTEDPQPAAASSAATTAGRASHETVSVPQSAVAAQAMAAPLADGGASLPYENVDAKLEGLAVSVDGAAGSASVPEGVDDAVTARVAWTGQDAFLDPIAKPVAPAPSNGLGADDGASAQLTVLEGGGGVALNPSGFAPLEQTPVSSMVPDPHTLVPIEADQDLELIQAELAADDATPNSLRSGDGSKTTSETLCKSGTDSSTGQVVFATNSTEGPIATPPSGSPPALDPLEEAKQLSADGRHEESYEACERLLDADPENVEAKRLLQRNRDSLQVIYDARLGDLEQVPVVQVPQHEIVWHKLDHRAGFLLSRIDGLLSYSDILDISGMGRFETCRILAQLIEEGVVGPR